MRGIVKRFGALAANDGIDLHVDAGEVLALLGENGAGKSTLMKILYGLYQPDAGEIKVFGQRVNFRSPADAINAGIGMVTQHFALVPTLTVAENIVLGGGSGILFNRAAAEKAVEQTSARFKLSVNPHALVRDLSVGEQQRVEILKALHRGARVLVLDEPTAVLTPREVDALFDELHLLVAEGLAIIFISHKLREVLAAANRVTVLRDGKSVGETRTMDASPEKLAEMLVGRSSFATSTVTPSIPLQPTTNGPDQPMLMMRDVHARDNRGLPALRGISLEVNAGEIVGIAGVSGNGQSELVDVLTGMRAISSGSVTLDGRDISKLSPADTVAAGIGRVPEDRKGGIVGTLSVMENLALEHLAEFTHGAVLDRAKMKAHAERLIAEYDIKATVNSVAGKLSGGNIQKVILARVLSRHPKLVVASQPTRGLDIGATEFVRTRLREAGKRGAAVLMVSEDLDEILAVADRIAVMFGGNIVGVLPAANATAEQIGLLMTGRITPEGTQ